ncbi:MAG: hypothetical protein FJX68_15350 [Alphaproteobacteria bacterium]|nr:hypothetical protein [Alphaproteobacteria bacterium]
MRNARAIVVLGLVLGTSPALAQDLALKRVLLSTGGVGYFEFEASVTGDAQLSLPVRVDQVDDVLKSLVVFDDAGRVGAVRLPGRAPIEEAFRDLPFPQAALESPVALLNALQGAEVQVAGPRPLKGCIMQALVEEIQLPNAAGTVRRHRVGVMTVAGLQQLLLEEAETLTFVDPALQARVEQALAAVARHGVRERRVLALESLGRGQRKVRVGYVAEAPLWKASYRLVLDGAPSAKQGRLQGWAVLENLSGHDWRQVELTVVAGNPVTFRQALYTAYFISRPEVPVEVLGRVLPPADERTVPAAPAPREARLQDRQLMGILASPAAVLARQVANESDEAAGQKADQELAKGAVATEAEEATTQVVFRYGRPVDLPAGETLLLPLIDRDLPVESVALYQRETHARHPLAAVRFRNDGASGLPLGVLALFERGGGGAPAFAGDARLAALPVGESRMLSFALDSKLTVDREDRRTQRLAKGTIAGGLLRLQLIERRSASYRVVGAPGEERLVILEHERLGGNYKLAQPGERDVELTPRHYRLRTALKPGATAVQEVVLERPIEQSYRLFDLTAAQIAAYVSAPELEAKLKRALEEMGKLRAAMDGQRRQVEQLEQERKEIAADQTRLRDNLARIPRDSQIHQRYLDKLGQQENRLEQLAPLIEQARGALARASQALSDYVAKLEV